MTRSVKQILLSLLLLAAHNGHALSILTDKMHMSCVQDPDVRELRCDYRMYAAAPVMDISAALDGTSLSVTQSKSYPWENAVTAILILVDTSDPARENVIVENRKIISRILETASPHDKIGLASFDKNLRAGAPVGATHEEILAAAAKLQAVGKTTELYRSVLTAIYLLKQVQADRKSIYLLSDGLAEDQAYFHQDVVNAARAYGIVITSLGFPRSVSQSVGLQTLRRLSEETGGIYVESDLNFQIPDAFLNTPFDSMDNGGRFTVNLPEEIMAGKDRMTVAININTATGSNLVKIPVDVPAQIQAVMKEPSQPVTAMQTPAAPAQPPIRIITREMPAEPDYFWSWYLVLISLIFLLIVVITAFFLTVYRQGKRKPSATAHATGTGETKPYAYLVFQDETKKRFPITRTTWRIGRGTDNEMVLQDNSVSRRHAEIHRDKGDVFTIFDLDSLNGVFVNDNKVHKQSLHEGDIIEIGEISLRFTLLSSDYSMEESTVMQHTRAPLTH